MDLQGFKPTKQVPGVKTELQQQIIDELKTLDEKRYHKTVPFFGGHPSSLVKKDQNQIFVKTVEQNQRKVSPYLLCQKTDGVRYLLLITNQDHLFISRQGKSKLVAYRSKCQIAKNWHINPNGTFKHIIHILDGEMISDKTKNGEFKLRYLIFDALVVFSRKIIEKPLRERLESCEKFVRCNQYLLGLRGHEGMHDGVQVKLKDFFRLSCANYVSSEVMMKKNIPSQPTTVQFIQKFYIRALPHENDGIIFNDQQKPYILGLNTGYIKWKPAEYNTVDFLVIPNTKLQGQFERRVLDLYLGWRDSEITSIYRMMFYNFTIVSQETFNDLEEEFNRKYEAAFDQNPDLVQEDSFGIIAECKYQKVEVGSEQFNLFKVLLSSMKKPKQIHQNIMRQQNQQKQLQVIKRIQGQPYTKFWQIFRIRSDKNLPNNHDVARKIEQSIKDDIKFQQLVNKNKQLLDQTRIP